MSDGCGCVVAEGSGTNIGILLHRDAFITAATAAFGRRQSPVATRREAQALRSDHALLVESLQVPDHLGDHPNKLARDLRDILLGQLPLLLSPGGRSAERRLVLRRSKLRAEVLQGMTLPELTQAEA